MTDQSRATLLYAGCVYGYDRSHIGVNGCLQRQPFTLKSLRHEGILRRKREIGRVKRNDERRFARWCVYRILP